ncbi:uncharacterized protein LOC142536962 isoform X6 [Primulina tabacum]|uniref:uncharacterized protein LOC142536962 isoform X6 n=1 Tax=Primulina tabacum TaxID=48773 RepID=UPI003F5A95B1
MGDHFVLLVDRLLTESTLEAAILSKNLLPSESTIENKKASFSINIMDTSVGSSTMKSEECRICHDEDEDSNMDTPCSCRGSLKYAHPKCVQRWCNEKGDTICEICHQQFKPEYTAPPPLFNYGGISVNFRGNWEISRGDLRAPHFMSMVSTNGSFPDPNFDEYTVHTSRSLLCCLHGSSGFTAYTSIYPIWCWGILNFSVHVVHVANNWNFVTYLYHGESIYRNTKAATKTGPPNTPSGRFRGRE